MKKAFITILMPLLCTMSAWAQVALTLTPDDYGVALSPSPYGIFFEEINHAADGGLWSEMVRNRSFEDDADTPQAWEGQNGTTLSVASDHLMNDAQQHYLHVSPSSSGAALVNAGYWGMRMDRQPSYTLSFFARADRSFSTTLTATLLDESDKPLISASQSISIGTSWQKFTLVIPDGNATEAKAHLLLQTTSATAFDLDVVSLMPANTYKGHGCRTDLAQMLADLKPRFMRFPGGCYIEGQFANGERNRFEWKKTIGPIEERPGHWNINWNYRSSDAFGYHEMLQLSEDLGSEALFVVNVGLGHGWYQDINDLGEFIQEALDAIEYANGDASTTWGAKRAANGHPAPFNLKYIEIGNENYNFSSTNNNDQSFQYAERYSKFYQAIKAAYPDIICIGNVEAWGTDTPSWRNNYPVDAVDEHYYRSPEWFASNYEKYDVYNRATSPKVYVGEYAVTENYGTTGNLAAALGEAIYMQGIERNADIVPMASYAPIFVNENDQCWRPDMIRFDATYSYGTPSYYVQKLMSQKLGTANITYTEKGNNTLATKTYAGLSTWSTAATFTDYRISQGGTVVYSAPFDGTAPWTDKAGTFSEQGGTLTQSSTTMQGLICLNQQTALGEAYTIEVTATKTAGDEGFLIAFNYIDDNNYCWWNLGGWGNTKHCIEQCVNGSKAQYGEQKGSLVDGKAYRLRIEVEGAHVKCYIDDVLCHDVKLPIQRRVFTSASRDGNKLYVKLVNPHAEGYTTTLTTTGYTASNLTLTQMASVSDQDENTTADMHRVVPTETALPAYGTNILLNIPPYSLNIVEMDITPGENTTVGVMPTEGTYYLKDIDSGLFLARGSNWGTRATLSALGIPAELTIAEADVYRIRFRDLADKYLGNLTHPYTDTDSRKTDETQWRFVSTADGGILLESKLTGTYFACAAENEGATFTEDKAKATRFRLISPDEYERYVAGLNPLQESTRLAIGTDVSHLLTNASMDTGTDGWQSTFHRFDGGGNPVLVQPTSRAQVSEAFELTGELSQTVSGLVAGGIYRFTIPAFFRAASNELCAASDREGLNLGNAYLRCGDQTTRLSTWASDRKSDTCPNSMEEASECFSEGLYQNVVTGRADADGHLTIALGIPQRNPAQWLIWGGARLEQVVEPVDYTDHIINPSFEQSLTSGWTNNGMQRQNNTEQKAGKVGNYYCEKWVSNTNALPDASVTQTVTGLRAGDYLVTAICHAERQGSTAAVSGAYLMAGNSRTPVTLPGTYSVVATATNGELTIGFGCEGTDANWITVDDFHMQWIGSSAESNKAALQSLIRQLQELLDTKTILTQQQRDEAAQVIARARAATTDDEVSQAITEVSTTYDELLAYRIPVERNEDYNAYLFAYFPNNSDENLYYALSTDGFNYTPLNNGRRILSSADFTITGGIRDPHILRGEDGIFRMVCTDMVSAMGWSSNRGITMSTSTDLIHWKHSTIHFPTRFPDGWSSVTRVWAPETIYDRETGKYMVYFSLLTSDDGTCRYDKVFYCYANDDFTDLEDYPVHLFDRGSATIDADIIYDETDQLYHMIYKNEGIASISHVSAHRLTAPEGSVTGSQWGELGGGIQQTSVAVEGGGIFRLIGQNTYVVMYDCYGSGYYQFCTTTDWRKYTLQAQTTTSGAFTPRHGSVTPLHPAETRALLDAFPTDGFDIDCSTAISSPAVSDRQTAAGTTYDLTGRPASVTQKGILIVKATDGAVRKVAIR